MASLGDALSGLSAAPRVRRLVAEVAAVGRERRAGAAERRAGAAGERRRLRLQSACARHQSPKRSCGTRDVNRARRDCDAVGSVRYDLMPSRDARDWLANALRTTHASDAIMLRKRRVVCVPDRFACAQVFTPLASSLIAVHADVWLPLLPSGIV